MNRPRAYGLNIFRDPRMIDIIEVGMRHVLN